MHIKQAVRLIAENDLHGLYLSQHGYDQLLNEVRREFMSSGGADPGVSRTFTLSGAKVAPVTDLLEPAHA